MSDATPPAAPETPPQPAADERQDEKPKESAPQAPEPTAPETTALQAREKELLERLARLQADFDNYRRRAREEAGQARSQGKLEFVKALIPVIDNLDRALAHSNDEGLNLLARHMHATLASAGLVTLSPEGEAFDAKVHEAIAQEPREGVKAGTVVTVVEKGYVLDGRMVRPARVIVAT
ncbi:MAG TPA: nucleotide exchange factor GrpE [Candidatus Thermoplasmatota archaeon]|nr:nucleotide exchange factor GrpE [Candidatus Thermoplasmatota archaeon]